MIHDLESYVRRSDTVSAIVTNIATKCLTQFEKIHEFVGPRQNPYAEQIIHKFMIATIHFGKEKEYSQRLNLLETSYVEFQSKVNELYKRQKKLVAF